MLTGKPVTDKNHHTPLLTSVHGLNCSPEAASYALAHLEVDWNEQCLRAAREYQELTPMPKEELLEELVSPQGAGFTDELLTPVFW